jgi:hypothetical protein
MLRGLRRPSLARDAGDSYSRVLGLLEQFARNDAPEIRQASYETMAELAPSDAKRSLIEARERESDTELTEVLSLLLVELEQGSRG